jgi:hypothetical protein
MRTKHTDPATLLTLAQKATAPVRQFNEMLLQNAGQVLSFQYGLMGDWLNLGLQQMTAAATASDPAQFMARQAALGASLLETATKRGEDLAQISTDVQARFAKWADDAFDPDAFGA